MGSQRFTTRKLRYGRSWENGVGGKRWYVFMIFTNDLTGRIWVGDVGKFEWVLGTVDTFSSFLFGTS